MKVRTYFVILLLFAIARSSAQNQVENVIMITIDGFRWQEVFNGMDSTLANNPKYNQRNQKYLYTKFWSDNLSERRKKLMPFLWNTIAANGQIYGNRQYENNVNVANPYWFSYPGYSEIFCGRVDTLINSNDYIYNPNPNFFEFLNSQPKYKDQIALFGAWGALPYIANNERNHLVVASSNEQYKAPQTEKEQLLASMLNDAYSPWGKEECLDSYIFYQGFEFLKTHQPKVLYLSFGETDEWAHGALYKNYLDIAHTTDKWIEQIWTYVQSTKKYKNKTLLLVTVDHGRGEKNLWVSHGTSAPKSDQTWFAIMGPGISPKGEMTEKMQVYNKQYAKTICALLGLDFNSKDKTVKAIKIP